MAKKPVQTSASRVTAPLRQKRQQTRKEHTAKRFALFGNFGKRKKAKSAVEGGGYRQDAWRYHAIWLAMAAGLGILTLKSLWVSVVNAKSYMEKSEKMLTTVRKLDTQRGLILDRHGAALAANAPLQTVIFDPRAYAELFYETHKKLQQTTNPARRAKLIAELEKVDLVKIAATANYPLEKLQAAVKLNQTLDYKAENIDEQIQKSLPTGKGSRRIVLLDKVSPEVADPVLALNEKSNVLAVETQYRRYYLQAEPNAQLIGYMGRSDKDEGLIGRAGLEAQYNHYLSGEAGQLRILRDKNNKPISEIEEIKPRIDAKDLHLTIDSRLQYVLYKELEQVGRLQSARSSSGIVVDVKTGEVLAMTSWPSFNSNNLSEINGGNEQNRPLLDVFEPGSVVKPITVAAALESGKYSTSSIINTSPGSLFVGGYTIRDGANFGAITLSKLIQKSSNVASTKIALSLPTSSIVDMQRKFGFGQKTHLNFPAEAKGKVPTPKDKEYSLRSTLSYGYGQEVTLAQIAQAYATIANQGVMRPLSLVKDVKAEEPKQVISAKHAQDIIKMMELVTADGGTAKAAAINGYRVAGKSGTSRRINPKGGYYTNQHRAIFAGMAPASSPRFVAAILVEDPRKQFYAGQVSAPVFHNVMQETLRLYNVPYDKPLYVENDTQTDSHDKPKTQ